MYFRQGGTVEKVVDFAGIATDLEALWYNTYTQAREYQREVLNAEYFRLVSQELGEKSFVLLCKKGDSLIGFTMLLDAGDSLINDQHPAKRTRGQSSIELMNLMGYDAVTIGALDIAILTLDELQQCIALAQFPMLSANAYVVATDELLAEPYTVIEVGKHRVAVLGLTDVPAVANEAIRVDDPVETAERLVPQLREVTDAVIVLSHAGLATDTVIADSIAGVDLVVSGRNQTINELYVSEYTGTALVHADVSARGAAGETIGVAHAMLDSDGLIVESWERVTLMSDIDDDPVVSEWLYATPTPQGP